MIEKLRSRHPIDLPTEGFGLSRALFVIWGGIASLFVGLPLAYALKNGALDAPKALAIAFGALLIVLLVGAVRGKAGHARR